MLAATVLQPGCALTLAQLEPEPGARMVWWLSNSLGWRCSGLISATKSPCISLDFVFLCRQAPPVKLKQGKMLPCSSDGRSRAHPLPATRAMKCWLSKMP